MVLLDSNVSINILTEDPIWRGWSEAVLSEAADREDVAINPIIYAEIAAGFATMGRLIVILGLMRFEGWRCLMRLGSWLAGHLWRIVGVGGSGPRRCRISMSAPMRRFRVSAC